MLENTTGDEMAFFSVEELEYHSNTTDEERKVLLLKLSKVTSLLKEETYRNRFPGTVLQKLTVLASSGPHIEVACEIFRIMRNASAGSYNVEMRGYDWDHSVRVCSENIRQHHTLEEESFKVAVRCGLQFLVNLLNSSPVMGNTVWSNVKDMLMELWTNEDAKIREFSLAVFHGILRSSDEGVTELLHDSGMKPLVEKLVSCAHDGSQFGNFAVHLLLDKEDFLPYIYGNLNVSTRISLLQLIEEKLQEEQSADAPAMTQNVQFLSEKFVASADIILQTCEQSTVESLEPVEVCSLLQVLAAASAMDQYRQGLQKNKQLVTATTDLLRSIHSRGKSGSNAFSILSDLSSFRSLSETDENAIQNHPVFGFKRSLVRLLANLCWEDKENQDLVRNEDTIPVLLECSNLDARNPFIQQFAVLALKSLCQGNVENQAVIASMTRRGVVQPAVLEQLGMSVEEGPTGLRLNRNN